MKSAWLIISSILLVALGFLAGRVAVPPQVEYKTIIQNIPQTEYVYITEPPIVKEVVVEKIIEVEKLVEVYKLLSDWDSLAELETFLAQDDTDSHLYLKADENGVIKLEGNCEDFAFQLRNRAFEIGRQLETEALTPAEYVKYYGASAGFEVNAGHMINKAVIGNEVWFIEPSDDRIWFTYYLD